MNAMERPTGLGQIDREKKEKMEAATPKLRQELVNRDRKRMNLPTAMEGIVSLFARQ